MHWQLQEAKQRFSEVVRRALTEGPQLVTRHGRAVAVVMSTERYEELTSPRPGFLEFLLAEDPHFDGLELGRSRDHPREVAL